MSLRRPAKNQPESFEFSSSSLEAANQIISNYPKGKQQSAVMALLYIAQKQNNLIFLRSSLKHRKNDQKIPFFLLFHAWFCTVFSRFSPCGSRPGNPKT